MVFCNCYRKRQDSWCPDVTAGSDCRAVVKTAWDAPQMDPNQPHLGPMRLPTQQWKVLLVFPRTDSVSDAWQSACLKRGLEATLVSSYDQTVKQVGLCVPHLVVLDGRTPRTLPPTSVARALRGLLGHTGLTILAVMRKNFAEKDSNNIVNLLDSGINRVVVESSSVAFVTAELTQLERGELLLQVQRRAMQAVFAALDACRDAVHITDHNHRIQYINKPCETLLGYSSQDVIGKSIWEVHGSDHHRQELRGLDLRKQQTDTSSRPTDVKTENRDGKTEGKPTENKTENRATELSSRISEEKSEADEMKVDKSKQQIMDSYTSAGVDIGKPPHKVLERQESKVGLDISEAINLQLRRGREWEGVVMCRRKSGDLLHLPSRVMPVPTRRNSGNSSSAGLSSGDYIVYSSSGSSSATVPAAHSGVTYSDRHHTDIYHNRGSIKSLRKTSYDIRSLNSDGSQNTARRQSIVKLHSVTIEAPITRVISIITSAQENSPVYVSQALEKVLEILRSKELYSPQLVANTENIKPVPADAVATDLLGALLSQHSPTPLYPGRRSSNDTSGSKPQVCRPNLSNLSQAAATDVTELLTTDNSWAFDIIRLEQLTEKRPLVSLGLSLMCQMNVPATLHCDEQTLQNWLTLIEANYHADNSYHNSTHAADVLHATAYFLQRPRIAGLLDPLDVAAALVAAAVHDVDHPGKNSAFLCNTNNELAVLYNDTSVLESHHSALSFKLTNTDARVNIYKGLDRDTYKEVRKSVLDMVLATDMTKHFEHLSKFVNMLDKCSMTKEDCDQYETVGETLNVDQLSVPENQQILRRMLIKCADVSNPLRPRHLCIDWGYRIANEYFSQTEEEKRRNLPIVMPQFDRSTCSIPKSQIGFIDFFISDMFEAWDTLADIPDCMSYLRSNYQYWQEMEERDKLASSASGSRPASGVSTTPVPEEDEGIQGLKLDGTITEQEG